ncbi:5717_t:CDS:2 [Entrophospora sp. SA101]|nr:5717_t:CDS:2 [Entrophospora sp. SA101]
MSSKSFEKPLSEIGKIFKKLKRMSYHHNNHPQEDKTKEKKQKKSHKKATKRASMPILSSSKQQQNHFLNQKQKSNSLKVRNTKIETRNSLDMIDKNIPTSSNNSYVNAIGFKLRKSVLNQHHLKLLTEEDEDENEEHVKYNNNDNGIKNIEYDGKVYEEEKDDNEEEDEITQPIQLIHNHNNNNNNKYYRSKKSNENLIVSNNNNNNNTILIEKKHDNNKISYDDCENCSNNFNSWNWCQPCNSKRFEKLFSNWTSNSFIIDKFIQKTQLSSKGHFNKLEWIPFERFKDINLINNESFLSTVYEAIWIDGDILNWNHEKGEWMRFGQKKVVLKTLEKITIDEGLFDEIEKCLARLEFDECTNLNLYFGFTQNPKTKIYMIVMDYAPDGNLHQFIKSSSYYKNISWFDKISLLYNISFGLKELHDINIVHGNLHPGNILQHYMVPKISDYGLFKNVSRQILNNFLETYHGFIQNVDEIKDDEGGSGKGGRTPKSLLDLMKRCWDKNPDNRPSAFDLCREFSKFEWWTIDQRIKKYNHDDGDGDENIYNIKNNISDNSNRNILLKKSYDKKIHYEIHPKACYYSKLYIYNNILDFINNNDLSNKKDEYYNRVISNFNHYYKEEQQKLYFKNDNIILYYYRIIN